MIKAGKNMTIDDMKTRILTTLQKERGPLPYVQLQEKARLQQENDFAKAMAEQLSYDLNTKLDDITCESLQAGHLIDKENIKPVFLRMDSELADKGAAHAGK